MQQLTGYPGLPQVEPALPTGAVPAGFDPSTCRSIYVGNIHVKVNEAILADIFSAMGPLEGCKLIRKEKSSYGFIDFFDHRAAQAALLSLNGRLLFGQAIKVNWAYAGSQKEDTSAHINIFVGDLGPEVTDAALFAAFSIYSSCSDARVMWDHRTGRSRGYGFVAFRSQVDAEAAIADMNGRWLGSRPIRCNWATKGASSSAALSMASAAAAAAAASFLFPQGAASSASAQSAAGQQQAALIGPAAPPAPGSSDEAARPAAPNGDPPSAAASNGSLREQEGSGSGGGTAAALGAGGGSGLEQAAAPAPPPGNSSEGTTFTGSSEQAQYTTVYVGNLSSEVTPPMLHREFYALNCGVIEDVKVQREKGFGFVRYRAHEEAAAAISAGNGRLIFGKPVKCSWGSKPTIPSSGTSSGGLPPPALAPMYAPTYAPSDLLAYQQRMRGLIPPHQQPGLGVGMGVGMGAGLGGGTGGYDSFPPGMGMSHQQHMYY